MNVIPLIKLLMMIFFMMGPKIDGLYHRVVFFVKTLNSIHFPSSIGHFLTVTEQMAKTGATFIDLPCILS